MSWKQAIRAPASLIVAWVDKPISILVAGEGVEDGDNFNDRERECNVE
jgi:hypothetical protein